MSYELKGFIIWLGISLILIVSTLKVGGAF